jgi:2'-hydroxyisoflavone reductase
MASPGPHDEPFQMLDARDLAAFVLDRIESAESAVYGVAGPSDENSMQDTLTTAREVSGAETEFVWLPEEFLRDFCEDASRWFPMWQPGSPFHTYDASKALRAGLEHRPLAETLADTLGWDEARGKPELRFGLSPERERELLGAWRSSR